MPAKSVVQYTCERCTRVWYLSPEEPAPKVKLKLLLELGRAQDDKEGAAVSYECLCDSCAETVQSLVKSLAPLKPRAPRAKKKDEPAGGAKPPANSPSTTPEAPSPPAGAAGSSAPHAPSSAGASSGGVGRQPPPPAASSAHPRR